MMLHCYSCCYYCGCCHHHHHHHPLYSVCILYCIILGVVNCGRGSKNCPQKMSKLFWPFILIGSRTWKGKKSHPSRWISILTPVGQKTVPSKEVPSVFVPTPRFHAKISLVVKLGLGTKQKTAILRGKFSIYFLGCQLCLFLIGWDETASCSLGKKNLDGFPQLTTPNISNIHTQLSTVECLIVHVHDLMLLELDNISN